MDVAEDCPVALPRLKHGMLAEYHAVTGYQGTRARFRTLEQGTYRTGTSSRLRHPSTEQLTDERALL